MTTQFDEIGQIISIGALFIIGIGLLLRHLIDLETNVGELMKFKLPAVVVAPVLLAMLYSMGILIQSISKNGVANRVPSIPIPNYILPPDQDSRAEDFDTFYNEKATTREKKKLDGIFCHLFTDIDSDCKHIEDKEKSASDYDKTVKNRFFFYAKNKIFNEIKFYPELKSIESRLFFATSLTLLSFYFLILIFIKIWYLIFFDTTINKTEIEGIKPDTEINEAEIERSDNEIEKCNSKQQEYAKRLKEIQSDNPFKKYKYEFIGFVILLLLLIAGSVSYHSLQDSFNFRIFGYYTTSIS